MDTLSRGIKNLIAEGDEILASNNLESYDKWKRSVQFFVEKHGTPSMIKEIEKEVNRRPIWITYTNAPEGHLEEQINPQKFEQIRKLISLLEAICSINGSNTSKTKKPQKRSFNQTTKNHVWHRQDGKCTRCKAQLKPISTQYDHIIAWEDGGKSDESNCQALCSNCHSEKTNEDRLNKIGAQED